MEKIGRNSPCPCGSGLKYKKCCLAAAAPAEPEPQIYVRREIDKLQEAARTGKLIFRLVGGFIFFTAPGGDAWVLELVGSEALVVARSGRKQEVRISETPETVEINWSHSYVLKAGKFMATSYLDGQVEEHAGYPLLAIRETIKKIGRNFSGQLLDQLDIEEEKS
jgi:hypothetical protein